MPSETKIDFQTKINFQLKKRFEINFEIIFYVPPSNKMCLKPIYLQDDKSHLPTNN